MVIGFGPNEYKCGRERSAVWTLECLFTLNLFFSSLEIRTNDKTFKAKTRKRSLSKSGWKALTLSSFHSALCFKSKKRNVGGWTEVIFMGSVQVQKNRNWQEMIKRRNIRNTLMPQLMVRFLERLDGSSKAICCYSLTRVCKKNKPSI